LIAVQAAGKKYAELVGVNDYKLERLPALAYCENDVAALASILREAGYGVTLLCDSAGKKDGKLVPSKANIDRALEAVLKKCERGDTILVAFAGHGLQFEKQKDAFFCPVDARPLASATDSLVSLAKVYEQLDGSFASVKLLFVDACRNDPGPEGRGIDADSAPRPPSGVAALFSCRAGERAHEHKKYQHGIFFYHLLQGLKGEAKNTKGNITFASLAEYVQEQVSNDVPKLIGGGAHQSPNMKADLSGPALTLIAKSTTPKSATPQDAHGKIKDATVYLRVKHADGKQAEGSGFFAGGPGMIVINAHILGDKPPTKIEVLVRSGEADEKTLPGTVVNVDRNLDVATVRVTGDGLPAPLPLGSASTVKELQTLHVCNFPFGKKLGANATVSTGSVASIQRNDAKTIQKLGLTIQSVGNGGPVYDADGRVVGILLASIKGAKISFAVPVDAIKPILEEQKKAGK
jgi:S1-C subfamily serine protease